jgi:hypothetical protein
MELASCAKVSYRIGGFRYLLSMIPHSCFLLSSFAYLRRVFFWAWPRRGRGKASEVVNNLQTWERKVVQNKGIANFCLPLLFFHFSFNLKKRNEISRKDHECSQARANAHMLSHSKCVKNPLLYHMPSWGNLVGRSLGICFPHTCTSS